MNRKKPFLWREILRLAIADLRSEMLLTACLIGALVAIVMPLLILAGLRSGIVDSLRDDLIRDPVFREIRPAETKPYSTDFFIELRGLPHVEFVQEGISRGASSVAAIPAGNQESILLDMLPTAFGDPLLTSYDAAVPQEGEGVLSASAATALSVLSGDALVLEIGRQLAGRREVQRQNIRVVGVLPERADSLPRIYLPFALVRDIELYREGFGITARSWPGTSPEALPGFNGLYIHSPHPLNSTLRSQLLSVTGFFDGGEATPEQYQQQTQRALSPSQSSFRLSTMHHLAGPGMLERVRGLLLGETVTLLPYVENITVELAHNSEKPSTAFPLACQAGSPTSSDISTDALLSVQLPRSLAPWQGQKNITLHLTTPTSDLTLPVQASGVASGEYLVVSSALAGMLKRGQQQQIIYDTTTGRLLTTRTSFRGFRLYADNIDAVPDLVKTLQRRGIETVAQVGTIERIRTMDQGLMKLLLLIAVIGGSGAAIVLLINLYAAVERKVAMFGHLRLLGLTRKEIFFYPMCQGMLISTTAAVVASLGAALGALLINQTLAGDLGFSGTVCRMQLTDHLLTGSLALFLSLAASLAAAIRVTGIDPAEAVRVE